MRNLIKEQCSTFHAWSMYVVTLFIAAWFGQQFAIMFATFLKRINYKLSVVGVYNRYQLKYHSPTFCRPSFPCGFFWSRGGTWSTGFLCDCVPWSCNMKKLKSVKLYYKEDAFLLKWQSPSHILQIMYSGATLEWWKQ